MISRQSILLLCLSRFKQLILIPIHRRRSGSRLIPLNLSSLLLAQLKARRSDAIRTAIIPAIVDASTWNTLNLHPGATFNLYKNTVSGPPMRYIAIAQVQQFSAIDNASGGGIMVDYQSLASVIAAASPDHALVSVNHIWLRTESNSASLATVRTALTTSPLQLDNLSDRRALSKTLGYDTLSLYIIYI